MPINKCISGRAGPVWAFPRNVVRVKGQGKNDDQPVDWGIHCFLISRYDFPPRLQMCSDGSSSEFDLQVAAVETSFPIMTSRRDVTGMMVSKGNHPHIQCMGLRNNLQETPHV